MSLPPNLKLSRFCHVFQKDGYVALFHTLKVQPLFFQLIEEDKIARAIINRESFFTSELEEGQEAWVHQLLKYGVFVGDDSEDTALLEEVREDYIGYPDISILYLLLTDQCNLACKYCFIEGAMPKQYEFSIMSRETAEKAIDLFDKQLRDTEDSDYKPMIIFYGGEPTANWETLQSAVLYAENKKQRGELHPNTELSIITNGTLLDSGKIQFLKDNRVGLSISIDGPASNNDSRVFVGGRKSIDKVMESFQRIKDLDVPVSISCTITPQNVDNLQSIGEWLIGIGAASVGFNILMDVPGKPLVSEELVYKAAHGITECYEMFRKRGVYEDRMGRKIDAFSKQRIYPFDCGGYGGQIVIAPDGHIGICHAYLGERKYFNKNVHDTTHLDPREETSFVEWSNRSPLNMDQYYDCPVLGICGGGCAKNAELRHGTIWGLDDRFCVHAKHTLEWMIWDLFRIISKSNGKGGEISARTASAVPD